MLAQQSQTTLLAVHGPVHVRCSGSRGLGHPLAHSCLWAQPACLAWRRQPC